MHITKLRVWSKTEQRYLFEYEVESLHWGTIGEEPISAIFCPGEDYIVEQSTLFEDLIGIEIFNHDILELSIKTDWDDERNEVIYIKERVFVIWKNAGSCYCYRPNGDKWDIGESIESYSDKWWEDLNKVRVVGNINQNPEQLFDKS